MTTYEEGLSQLLTGGVLPNLPAEVELEGGIFAPRKTVLDPSGHLWAGQTTYACLANHDLLEQKPHRFTLRLLFASPTTFRSSGRNIPLPLPGLVFGSLVERWNAFSSVTIPAEVRRYAEECLSVARHTIRTRLVEVAGGKQVGFVGSCSYIATNQDPYWWRLINLLADFAFYSGVGAKTTMGMGQCKRIAYASTAPNGAGGHAEEGDLLVVTKEGQGLQNYLPSRWSRWWCLETSTDHAAHCLPSPEQHILRFLQ